MSRPSPLISLLFGLLIAVGCQSGPRLTAFNPFHRAERTTYETPAKRIAAIRAVGDKATKSDSAEQQKLVAGLAGPLANESDALVRQTTIETLARFGTPLAQKALLAGLGDTDPHVRQTACRLLAERGASEAAAPIAKLARSDENLDVRIAAAKALGEVGADKALLLAVLEDPNPAVQLVGVEAMRRTTGQDLGGDVGAYITLARGETPSPAADEPATAVANRRLGWLPFF